jgi:hypothetical protein
MTVGRVASGGLPPPEWHRHAGTAVVEPFIGNRDLSLALCWLLIDRNEIERQLLSLEYHDARERGDRRPGSQVTRLRRELGLDAEPLAA